MYVTINVTQGDTLFFPHTLLKIVPSEMHTAFSQHLQTEFTKPQNKKELIFKSQRLDNFTKALELRKRGKGKSKPKVLQSLSLTHGMAHNPSQLLPSGNVVSVSSHCFSF